MSRSQEGGICTLLSTSLADVLGAHVTLELGSLSVEGLASVTELSLLGTVSPFTVNNFVQMGRIVVQAVLDVEVQFARQLRHEGGAGRDHVAVPRTFAPRRGAQTRVEHGLAQLLGLIVRHLHHLRQLCHLRRNGPTFLQAA